MCKSRALLVLVTMLLSPLSLPADDDVTTVRKAVERSTLNQPGTHPFHLKAVLAPKRTSDQASDQSGEIEIWWVSPTEYRREIRTPKFHQIDVVNDGREWQKTDGNYFPEWLREVSVALIEPVPNLELVLKQIEEADVKKLAGATHFSWTIPSSNGEIEGTEGAGLSIADETGLLQYGSGFGWSGEYGKYDRFHDRMVARSVSAGNPEVIATVMTLEDLGDLPANVFDTSVASGDAPPFHSVLATEMSLRKNLLAGTPPEWPTLEDGPVEGALTTTISVDRTGRVREVGTIVSNNPAVDDTARRFIAAMKFQPYLQDGVPVQVVSRITLAFKSVRPAGAESFDSARNYFERGRQAGFLAAVPNASPYVLHATFQARTSAGSVEEGHYTDTGVDENEWRREATIGKSRCVRTRHGEKYYRQADGPDAAILQLVMKALEPIPAIDTFVESDWKIKRDPINGVNAIRVLTGYVQPDGSFDAEHVRAYWFDDSAKLLKSYSGGLEERRSAFESYSGIMVARQIGVYHDGSLGLLVRVTDISPAEASALPEGMFEVRGHEWRRAFTDEVR